MKTWQIYLLIVGVIFLIVTFLPENKIKHVLFLLVFITSFWAYGDAKKLQISKYKKMWFTPSTYPGGVYWICMFLWPVAFPAYINYRQKIIEGKIPLKIIEAGKIDDITATERK